MPSHHVLTGSLRVPTGAPAAVRRPRPPTRAAPAPQAPGPLGAQVLVAARAVGRRTVHPGGLVPRSASPGGWAHPRVAISAAGGAAGAGEPQPRPFSAIVVGGSSGMGKAAAAEVVRQGGHALIVSRSAEKLDRARAQLEAEGGAAGGTVATAALDNTDEAAVRSFFEGLPKGSYDALVVSAADKAVHGAFTDLDTSEVRAFVDSKFWGAYACAKHAAASGALADGGSITFFSGVLSRRPGVNCSPLAICNGAIEGLTRALALELGPRLRVNCFSPGFHDTERFDAMDPARRASMLENTAASLPLRRVGLPEDAGQALFFLMSNRFTTAVVLDVDGGHQVRQYANAATDPFRKD